MYLQFEAFVYVFIKVDHDTCNTIKYHQHFKDTIATLKLLLLLFDDVVVVVVVNNNMIIIFIKMSINLYLYLNRALSRYKIDMNTKCMESALHTKCNMFQWAFMTFTIQIYKKTFLMYWTLTLLTFLYLIGINTYIYIRTLDPAFIFSHIQIRNNPSTTYVLKRNCYSAILSKSWQIRWEKLLT